MHSSVAEKRRVLALSYEIKVFLIVLFVFFAELMFGLASLSGEQQELSFLFSGTRYGFNSWLSSPDPLKWVTGIGAPAVIIIGAFMLLHAGKHVHKKIRRHRTTK